MNESGLVEQAQPIQELLCKDTDERRTKTTKLVLFDQLVQVDAE